MKSHAENNPVLRISMLQTGGGFVKVCWRKSRALIQDVFRSTNIEIIVLLKLSKEPPYASQGSVDSFDNDVAAETRNDSGTLTSLALAQPSDPSVKNNFQWVTSGTPPSTHDLQGLPRATWHLVNEFHSLKIINDLLCREFVNKTPTAPSTNTNCFFGTPEPSFNPISVHWRPLGFNQNSRKSS